MNARKFSLLIFTFLLIFFSCRYDHLPSPYVPITPLSIVEVPDVLPEISGIIFQSQQYIYAHNDGGHGPDLYEISLTEKKVNKKVKITNATNVDWEDIAQDSTHIFVGDFGNNLGKRTDLKIYKLNKTAVQNMDSVEAEIIEFQYPDQNNFDASNQHNFDCEAMISWGDSLYLFSKNRGDKKTKCYALPKNPGNFSATLINEFDINGLVTGATINSEKNVIALLQYEMTSFAFEPYLSIFYDYDGKHPFFGKNKKFQFTFNGQMESICFGENHILYFAPESESNSSPQFIYQLDILPFLN